MVPQLVRGLYEGGAAADEATLGDGWSRWSVTVRYARRVGAKPVVFRSTLHVISEGTRIQSLTEHWRKPYPLNGGRRGLLPRWLRQAAGRVVS